MVTSSSLGGPFKTVEIDETFVGGYRRNGMGGRGKAVVFGMKQKGGELICRVVADRVPSLILGSTKS